MKCKHCGVENSLQTPVTIQGSYAGGQGLVAFPYCTDRTACWDRWNAQNMPLRVRELPSLTNQDTPKSVVRQALEFALMMALGAAIVGVALLGLALVPVR